jgi:hypothetical protein
MKVIKPQSNLGQSLLFGGLLLITSMGLIGLIASQSYGL